jgi:NADPH:quinone reductase-like Zn-dependent oxidoreductase
MKAIIYTNYGSPEVFQVAQVDNPVPKDNEVLVRIKATTVTTADCMMRRGDTIMSQLMLGMTHPKQKFQILGLEFSGTIESTGKHVKKVMKFMLSEDLEQVAMPITNASRKKTRLP